MICAALTALSCTAVPTAGVLPGGPSPPHTIQRPRSLKLMPTHLPKGDAVIRFGVTPYVEDEAMRRHFQPIVDHLTEVLRVPVELAISPSYEAHIQRVVTGEIHLSLLSPLSWVLALEQAPALQLLASEVAYGSSSYSSYVLVRADDDARDLRDLVGRRMAFVDQRSTSGYLFPYAAMIADGIDPETAFSEVIYAGSHVRSLNLLTEGKVDAACVASGLTSPVRQGKEIGAGDVLSDVRILYKAGRIPYDALVARGDLSKEATARILAAFLTLNSRSSHGRRVLPMELGINGFVPVEDTRYDVVRLVRDKVLAHRKKTAGGGPGG